ncbi:hypothetical protein MGYG_08747 [Nannizzia gypsea CBS 118893]|uniref:Uncharacterized protein n=1 Tax=Arthroderma gypseum (strain ATCC MYA-4604 / CBS 118893) TaxID=535722 RepID=E4V6V8_ARTGP|nr:hypothetical protein MGYG_08747 [Nannizzia gypsea CBS 118893]EFQ96824.1 hypothetical protein MGYG_08747 [Nannizzia gypsea CBS 118893]
MATHSRRRFRITGLKTPNPNLPPCDPSLWIVFYSKAPSIDQLPASRIPVSPQTQNILGQRRYIQSQGQLARKEFMLHDRNNWPTINLPPHGQQQQQPYPQAYAAQMLARQQVPHAPMQQQQVVGYPPGVVPPKVQRTQRAPASTAPATPDFSLDDEEVSTGDILDALTPRDISRMRYKNHHEWMEEVLASPYRMDQILPVDLGLGRKGELESLTKGYFYTPGALASQRKEGDGPPPASGKMDPGKAEDFANSVAKRLAEMNAEMENMRKKHARKLEKTKKLSALREAELNLRDAVIDPSDTGDEIWRVEGRLRPEQEDGMSPVDYSDKSRKKVDDILNGLQASWGRTVVPVSDINCLEKGGLQERVQPPPPPPQPTISDADMINTVHYGQYDRATDGGVETAPGVTAPSQGVPTSAASQPMPSSAAPPQPVSTAPPTSEDVVMGGVEPPVQSHATSGQPAAAEGDGDWIMVNKDGHTSAASPSKGINPGVNENTQQPITTTTGAPSTTSVQGTPAAPTAEATVPGMTPGATGEFEDENINTAGEALADYHGDVGGLDMGGIDDSAFGDAFHATEGDLGEHHHETDEIA